MPAGHTAVAELLDEEGPGGQDGVAGERFKGCIEKVGQFCDGGWQGGLGKIVLHRLPKVGIAP